MIDKILVELINIHRAGKIFIQITLDAFLIFFSFCAAVFFRTESFDLLTNYEVWLSFTISLLISIFLFWILGFYKTLVRYMNSNILYTVLVNTFIAAVILYSTSYVFKANLPATTTIIFSILTFLSLGAARFALRNIFRSLNKSKKSPVAIYGAGRAGLQVSNLLSQGPDYSPVVFLDDDSKLNSMTVNGLKVHSPENLLKLIERYHLTTVLLAIPSVNKMRYREIIKSLEDFPIQIKTIPRLSTIISGKAKISELRDLSVDDLLGREPVMPDNELLSKNIIGQVVMVSGAGGSIGCELCRQILRQKPSVLVLYEISEHALYKINDDITQLVNTSSHNTKIIPILGSVQDEYKLELVSRLYTIDTIYHAAAYKHVPIIEENIIEGINNNAFGTLVISSVAKKLKVKNFVLISTDKAVRPTNVMGASKRIAELICQAQAQISISTTFSIVRFGNVLGSSGSVSPRFKAQIENGGPVTVTHKDITRYFMTISEAAQLVIQAAAMGKGGDVFVLDMGKPVKILDFAISMIKSLGLKPHVTNSLDNISKNEEDMPIIFTGLRKGEKLYEELLIGKKTFITKHPRIMMATELSLPMSELQLILNKLKEACDTYNVPIILNILKELPLDYAPTDQEINDTLWNFENRL